MLRDLPAARAAAGISAMSENRPSALSGRRHDIDAVRLFAMVLLIGYHAIAAFMPFGPDLGMVQPFATPPSDSFVLTSLICMTFMNIWRIPVLFLVSGMAAAFSLRKRDVRGFVGERLFRLGLPLAFGSLAVFPLALLIWQMQGAGAPEYLPGPGHLWFLTNILVYAVLLAVGIWGAGRFSLRWPRWLDRPPVLVAGATFVLIAIVLATGPADYGAWAVGPHTLVFGLVCFVIGYRIALTGPVFRDWSARLFWLFGLVGLVLFGLRLAYEGARFEGRDLYPRALFLGLTTIEAMCWMLTCLGVFARWFSESSAALRYGSAAIFPVYILHYPVQNLVAALIGDLLPSHLARFGLLVLLELAICIVLYEILRRTGPLRALFGMKYPAAPTLSKA